MRIFAWQSVERERIFGCKFMPGDDIWVSLSVEVRIFRLGGVFFDRVRVFWLTGFAGGNIFGQLCGVGRE